MEGLSVAMEGFRVCLERATRVEEEIDWSVHTIDYKMFKRRLKTFAKRRSELRSLLRDSLDGRLPQSIVYNTIGQYEEFEFGMKEGGELVFAPTSLTRTPRSNVSPSTTRTSAGARTDSALLSPPAIGARGLLTDPFTTTTPPKRSRSVPFGTRAPTTPTSDYLPFVESNASSLHSDHRQTTGGWSTGFGSAFASGFSTPKQNQRRASLTGTMLVDVPPTYMNSHFRSSSEVLFPDIQGDVSSESSSESKTLRQRLKNRQIMRRVTNAERNELIIFLTWEMDKVLMFYLARWQRLSQLMVNEEGTSLISLGEEILELVAFCVINIVTVRQVLIRYDAFARTFEGTPILHYYMKKVTKKQSAFRKVLYHEELNALADSFSEAMMKQNPVVYESFQKQRTMFEEVLDRTEKAESVASTGHEFLSDTLIATLRHYFLLGGIEDRLGLQPEYLTMRGQSLTSEMAVLAEWRKRGPMADLPSLDTPKDTLTNRQRFQLALNLISGFLYCMNYYIVEPSSTLYVNALGAHDAMSGTLIGMTPLAAFLSAIGYSVWTNNSFRNPFIVSGLLAITGNLMYALAFTFRSLGMALAGRFLLGLGAPKVIIRRYMADTTPMSLRTSVNAGFGMVVAVGSAMGPATAIFLNRLHWSHKINGVGRIVINGLTAPGYFMAFLWTLFFIVLFLTFKEPEREGLAEQKNMEARTNSMVKNDSDNSSGNQQNKNPSTISPQDSMLEILESSNGLHVDTGQEILVKKNSEATDTNDYDLKTIFSGESQITYGKECRRRKTGEFGWWRDVTHFLELITLPVRICLGLLLAKTFTIEALVSATSALSKNRFHWQVHQVGTLGCINGILVVPCSILIGRLSMSYQDRQLMSLLISVGCFGMFLLIDLSDLVATPTHTYNKNHILAVGPTRYVIGYFLAYISIQSFEGIIGSALSKVIPTALASGTLNSGLLATLVDCFGRATGDLFISLAGFISLRQLMNLLFIPGFTIMLGCLVVVRTYYDILAV